MGIGTGIFILLAVGVSTIVITTQIKKGQTEPPITPQLPEFPINVILEPSIIDNDSARFEVTYINTSSENLRFQAEFSVDDPEGVQRVFEEQTLRLAPGARAVVFWETGDLLTLKDLDGNWVANFETFDRFRRMNLSQSQPVVLPVMAVVP